MDIQPYSLEDLNIKTDQEIVILVPKDKEVFAVLIKRYERALLRYVQRLGLAGEEDKVDVVQNTFIKAYRNILSFDTNLAFSTWLYRIAHNETISFFRSKNVRPEGNMIENAEEFLDRVYDDDSKADIAEEINKKINASHLNEALSKVDEKFRTILVLRYFEEHDYAEISDILQIPAGSVATLIHRAKKQLARYLAHIDESGGSGKVKSEKGKQAGGQEDKRESILKLPELPKVPELPRNPFSGKSEEIIKIESQTIKVESNKDEINVK